jgi:hypothetical protein
MAAFLLSRRRAIFRGLGRAWLLGWGSSLARSTRENRIACCRSNQMRCLLALPPQADLFERTLNEKTFAAGAERKPTPKKSIGDH